MLDLGRRAEVATEQQPERGGGLHVCVVTETFPPEINGVTLTLGHLVLVVDISVHDVLPGATIPP